MPHHDAGKSAAGGPSRPRVHGRFLFLGREKFFIKGVTYGPLPPDENGEFFSTPDQVARDFALMNQAGVNTVRVYYVPPRWFLDLAAEHKLYVLIGIPWPQHICFLDQWEVKEQVKEAIRSAARACKGHPAAFAYLIGNEIPSHIVRWHGAKNVEKFLHQLTDIVHDEDPGALVTYANYPSTEYLQLGFLDFLSFNVYLQEPTPFRAYLKRLQNQAGELPLVLSEFGLDSMRNGAEKQAETLRWQIRAAFELGVSGTFVFAWTDEWFTGGNLIEDWAFGVVTSAREEKPAFTTLKEAYRGAIPYLPPDPPMISVIVCAYNADSTMEGCLASFLDVAYPRFEVVIVDDGSTDQTGPISDKYVALRPDIFKVIHQPNRGLSAARNAGLYASEGDIIAYTDSDCYVDPHWLHYMAWAFEDGRFTGVGGPNLPPPEDNRIAACVAVSPGAPTHVLITDEIAEHIPGCNMAFKKDALLAIAGFDATYRAAGDDVDLCWRLQNLGYEIGFSAAMMVWHHRRNTIKAYLKQQKGYGRAEALLAPKHHERFNLLGNSRWAGRIYGDISGHTLTARPVIYHGVFGDGLFQSLYEPKGGLASHLPLSFEWAMISFLFLALGIGMPAFAVMGAAMIMSSVAWATHRALFARLPESYDDWRSRVIIIILTLLQPLLRGWVRYKTLLGLTVAFTKVRKGETGPAWLPGEAPRGAGIWRTVKGGLSLLAHHFSFQRYFWNHEGLERPEAIGKLHEVLHSLELAPRIDSGFSSSDSLPPWDFQIQPGMWSQVQLRVTVEHHGGKKRFIRLAASVLPTGLAKTLFLGGAALTLCSLLFGVIPLAGLLLGLTAVYMGWVIKDNYRAAGLIAIIAQHLNVCGASELSPNGECVPGLEPEPGADQKAA